MKYYIYILRCENDSLYTGIAKDFVDRFEKHKKGEGAKYTKAFKPIKIELVLCCENRSEASKVEKFIKLMQKNEKEIYIKEPERLIEYLLKSIKITNIKNIFLN